MALTDINLPAGKVIVIKSSSTLGLAANGKALNFGTVQRVNDLTDITVVGQTVLFDVDKALPFMIISGTIFYMIDETDIGFYETDLP